MKTECIDNVNAQMNESYQPPNPLLEVHIPSTRFSADDLAFLTKPNEDHPRCIRRSSKTICSELAYRPVTVTQTEIELQDMPYDQYDAAEDDE